MLSSVLVLVPFIAGINALNDWSIPCTTGECSYDLPTNSSASGSLKIWGSNNAITDITKAADWQILGCDSNALSQDIRLVCMNDPDDPNSKCGHLYQNIGAVNKIVRLPEDCGASAFARVSKSWVPDDQSIPTSVRRSLVRRGGKVPVVKALSLDTNFDSVDWSQTGPVNIAIQGANVPGVQTDIQTPTSRRRTNNRRFSIKGALGSVKDGIDNAASSAADAAKDAAGAVKDAAGDAASKVADTATKAADAAKDAATDAASKAKDAATKATSAVKGAATKVESKAKDAATKVASDAKSAATKAAGAAKAAASVAAAATNNTVDVNKTVNLKPLTFNKNVNLVNSQINCGKVSASLQVDMDANANAQASISVAATGTIVPPKMTKFGVVAGLTANVAGTMTMTADITGHVDSGKIQLVNLGIPGFDIPGILTLGPSFTVSAQVVGDVDVVMDMNVGINFDVNNAQLAFPPDDSNKPLSSAFSIGDTPLTLNAAPDVTATGTLTGHLIPSLNLGVNVFGGKAKADIFLNLDTNAALEMSLDGSASKTKVVTPPGIASSSDDTASDDTSSDDTSSDDTSADDTAATDDGSSTDASGSGELFQTDDGELVDADGNPVDENGAPLPDGASPVFVDQDGNIVDGPTSANATQKRADDAQAQLFQTDDGELVDEAGDPVDENGKKLGPNDPPVFVDSDGNIVDGPTGDNSTAAATDDSSSSNSTSTDQIFQTEDGELVDANSNPVDAEGNLLKDGDAPVCEDADGNVIDCPASVTDNAAAATDDSSSSNATSTDQIFQTEDGELVDANNNPVDAEGNLLKDGDAPVCEDADGNVIDCPASVTDGSATADDTTATDDGTTDDTTTDDTTTDGTETTKSFGGCVNVNGAISVNAGAEGSFFGLFDKLANAQLFSKNFKIFTKCFGDQATATTSSAAADASSTGAATKRAPTSLERRVSLTCPLAGSKKLGVTKGTVKSSSIKSSTA